MVLASAPWLLFGFFAAGLMEELIPRKIIENHMKRCGLSSVLKSSAFGIPLPLCSCSVIPVGVSLYRKGSSKGAATSFFISTPQIGVDSFFLSYALIGLPLSIARVVASFISAVVAGLLVDNLDSTTDQTDPDVSSGKSCCSKEDNSDERKFSISKTFKFGFITLVDDLAVVLLSGFLIAGLINALVPADLIGSWGISSFWMMIAMFAISTPVYVCATSSTPFAAALIAKGISPGAALVFLLAGPATNVSTILALNKELGRKSVMIYLASIIGVALAAGVFVDKYFSTQATAVASLTLDHHSAHTDLLSIVSAVIMTLLILVSIIKKIRR